MHAPQSSGGALKRLHVTADPMGWDRPAATALGVSPERVDSVKQQRWLLQH